MSVEVGLFLKTEAFMKEIRKVPGMTEEEMKKIESAMSILDTIPADVKKSVEKATKDLDKITKKTNQNFEDINKASKVFIGPVVDDIMDVGNGLSAVATSAGLSTGAIVAAGTALAGVGIAAAYVAGITIAFTAASAAIVEATDATIEFQKKFEELNKFGADLHLVSPEALQSLENAKSGFEGLKIPAQEFVAIATEQLAPSIEGVSRLALGLAFETERFMAPVVNNLQDIADVVSMIALGMFASSKLIIGTIALKEIKGSSAAFQFLQKTIAETNVQMQDIRKRGFTAILPDLVSEESMNRADKVIGALTKQRTAVSDVGSEVEKINKASEGGGLQSVERMVSAIRSLKGGITLIPQAPEVDKFTEFFDEIVAITPVIEKHATLWERIAAAAESQREAVTQSISDLGQIQGNLSSILGSRISELEAMKSNQNMSKQEIWLIDQKIAKNRAATEILFRAQQALSIANIAMLTAENIAKYAGNPFLMATAAAVGATSAAAVIAQSPPKYHSGMIPGEYPAVLTKGEAVLSRTGVAALGPDTVARANRGQSVSEGGSFFLALNNRVLDTMVSGAIRGGASTRLEIRKKSDTMLMMRRGIYA